MLQSHTTNNTTKNDFDELYVVIFNVSTYVARGGQRLEVHSLRCATTIRACRFFPGGTMLNNLIVPK